MLNIAVVNTLPIPSGAASVNRILSYTKGLVELGNKVTILSSGIAEMTACGTIDSVSYRCFRKKCNNFFFTIIEYVRTLLSIVFTINRMKYDVIIVVSNSLLLIYPLIFISRIKKIKVILEKSEFPFVLLRKGVFRRLYASFYVSTTYQLFDGLIVMTKPLMNYFENKIKDDCELIEVPMTVDFDRFKTKKIDNKVSSLGDYIAYCGDMAGNKDGVENLIEAFKLVEKYLPNLKLVLFGGASNKQDLYKLKEYVQRFELNNIIFYGKVSRDEIPAFLTEAKALVLARPSGLQSSGGFPTKLGEYLSTGNPVIVTAVGDIPFYLNNENSFIVEPDNNKAFADQILKVFLNYKEALVIGEKGKLLVENIFNYKIQSKRIHDYLMNII